MSVNKVILVGNLGKDPEVRYASSGNAICNFTMATTRTYKKDNQRVDETEWHRVVAFGRTGEVCGEYLQKGRQVYVEGRLQTRKWQDKDGNDRWTTEIVAERVDFIGSRGDAPSRQSAPPDPFDPPPDSGAGFSGGGGPDDVPF